MKEKQNFPYAKGVQAALTQKGRPSWSPEANDIIDASSYETGSPDFFAFILGYHAGIKYYDAAVALSVELEIDSVHAVHLLDLARGDPEESKSIHVGMASHQGDAPA